MRKLLPSLILVVLSLAAPVAAAETIDVSDDHGGSVAAYNQRWQQYAARGVSVRIVGPCQSACTVLLGHIPRSRICVTPEARFGFHMAHRPDMTALLWRSYASDIKAWINARGGLTPDFKWMSAPDTYRYFHRC
ncbi:MAG: hypothetical protein KGQ48_11450 [Bradyrhizobium sp.]|nr:hypothetical protein [Bradyrhizobium sp.]